ncbi:basigin [Epargyreus clarus]|uniref:basigin n=1 Tax=Epargyreus clarus TaxID=520877 RepID=UPI003C2C273B
MGRAFYWPLALLFLANVIPSKAQSAAGAGAGAEAGATTEAARAAAGGGGAPDRLFDVRGNITLRCTLPNDKTQEYIWKKNDTLVSDLWDLKDRYKLEHGSAEFKIERSQEDDFGNYSCSLPGAVDEQRWVLRGRPHVKLPANSNVVEGQKLKLVCKMVGKPYQRVTWQFSNSTEDNFTDVEEALGGRAELAANEQGVPGAALVLAAAARADAGSYRCSAPDAALPAVTVLRVKDMYAALWPFLGICAEVFVLCAIILVYEKRRTKPELDDSDTDNHDQKKS